MRARYNIAPTTEIAVVRLADGGTARAYFTPRWGLIPSWAKSAEVGSKMINARSETVAEKPSFRSAFRSRRCLIPSNGFYEWEKRNAAGKQPWLIGLEDNPLFAFAGLWEHWKSPEGEAIESCTILTTTASDSIGFIHPRMPVILDPEDYDGWLTGHKGTELLRPMASARLWRYPVSTRVGNVRNDDAALIKPLAQKVTGQTSLF